MTGGGCSTIERILDDTRGLLERYSRVTSEEVIPHMSALVSNTLPFLFLLLISPSNAFQIFPYTSISQLRFLHPFLKPLGRGRQCHSTLERPETVPALEGPPYHDHTVAAVVIVIGM